MVMVVDVVNESLENTLHTLQDGCVSDIIHPDVAESIQIMPNPLLDFSVVKFPLGAWDMEILDVQGRVLMSRAVRGRTTTLSRQHLGAGSYVLRLRNDQATAVVRFEIR